MHDPAVRVRRATLYDDVTLAQMNARAWREEFFKPDGSRAYDLWFALFLR